MNLRFTFVAEGSTDEALLPILRWAIRLDGRVQEIDAQFAIPSMLPRSQGLSAKIQRALELYPADLLFIHRDADRDTMAVRHEEIRQALNLIDGCPIAVPVVPVRMTEAWLMMDEAAIRLAAGNPRGTIALDLPFRAAAIERIADPKTMLHNALRTASDLRGRRLTRFNSQTACGLIAERMNDFAVLRQLSSFTEFETLLRGALNQLASV